MDFDAACNYLISLAAKESALGQVTMKREAILSLLDELGNPQFGRKTVHIAGSKGKGSTSTFIASVLSANQNRTAHFTSPHLHSFAERISFNRQICDQNDFAKTLTDLRPEIEKITNGPLGPVSTFGALTAMFFQLAKKRKIEWQVLEAGLGGLNDATNVLEKTEIVVFTAISLEHTAILGNSTTEIAENKSGIIRPGSIVILAPQLDAAVTEVIKRRCRDQQCELIEVQQQYKHRLIEVNANRQLFDISRDGEHREFSIPMLGKHQLDNASTAIASIDALVRSGENIQPQSVQAGLASAVLHGRLELISERPSIVVDGAHNAESLSALMTALETYFKFKRLVVILGASEDKDIDGMVAALKGTSTLIACPTPRLKSIEPERIVDLAKRNGIKCHASESLSLALDEARSICEEDDLICVTGSLYLVAKAREIVGCKGVL